MTEQPSRVIELDPFVELTNRIIRASMKAVDNMVNEETWPHGPLADLENRVELVRLHANIMVQFINGNFVGNVLSDIGASLEAGTGDDEDDEHFFTGRG